MRMMSAAFAFFAIAALIGACGGETDGTSGGGGSDASSSGGGMGGMSGSVTSSGTGSSCGSELAGSCACSTADVFSSACAGSGKACAEVFGEAIPFVEMAGSNDCGSNGTWTVDTTCPTAGRLGGCKDTIGSTAGCPIERTSWYYADPAANIATKEDVQAVCSKFDADFVEP